MENVELTIDLGSIEDWRDQRLSFAVVIRQGPNSIYGSLRVYCYDSRNMRKSGVLLDLSEMQINQLKDIIGKTENIFRKVEICKQTGQTPSPALLKSS
jgi:hypothetical protein